MLIDGDLDQVRIQAPAKLNLFLEVRGKREDGFHEIETLMIPVSLCDRITITKTTTPEIELAVELPARPLSRDSASTSSIPQADIAWDVPSSRDNLVVRAAELVRTRLGIKAGCRIELAKHIPSAAGLGGGSSDAAAVVVACLALWHQWDRTLATSVCAELGSDIPFFLGGEHNIGLALATGRGESCELLASRPALEFVITHPPEGCVTRDVYARVEKAAQPKTARKIIEACKAGQFQKIGAELFNALQFPASHLNAWIGQQLDILSQCGLQFRLMTGSGSACFALSDGTEEKSKLSNLAKRIGVTRVYEAKAWYAPPIEEQLDAKLS